MARVLHGQDDNAVKSDDEVSAIVNYVHDNLVLAGIVKTPEEFAWSSVHNYLKDGREVIEIDSDWWLD